MIIDIETVVFRDPVVLIGHDPRKLVTTVRAEDGWVVTMDTGSADEVSIVENIRATGNKAARPPIFVPRASVLCYTKAPDVPEAEAPSAFNVGAQPRPKAAGGKR